MYFASASVYYVECSGYYVGISRYYVENPKCYVENRMYRREKAASLSVGRLFFAAPAASLSRKSIS